MQVARAPQRRHAAIGWRGAHVCALIPPRGRVALPLPERHRNRDHRSTVLSPRHRRGDPARPVQGRLLRPRRDGIAADVAEVPPLQAAAIILPTVLAQDALTVWTYRRDWSAWNLKIMIPEHGGGHCRRRAVRGLLVRRPYPAGDRAHRRHFRAAALARDALRAAGAAARPADRCPVRCHRRLHHHAGQCRRPGLADAPPPAAARQAHLCRHLHHPVCRQQPDENSGLWRARPADGGKPRDRRRAAAGGGDGELWRHLAGAADADRFVLPHRLCADVPDLGRTDPQARWSKCRGPEAAPPPCANAGGKHRASISLLTRSLRRRRLPSPA